MYTDIMSFHQFNLAEYVCYKEWLIAVKCFLTCVLGNVYAQNVMFSFAFMPCKICAIKLNTSFALYGRTQFAYDDTCIF